MSPQEQLKLQLMQAIRDWIQAQHLTQTEAAQRLGIEQPVVSEILKLHCRYAPGWLLDAWVQAGGQWQLILHPPTGQR